MLQYQQSFIEVGLGEQEQKGQVAVYEQTGLPEYYDSPILMCHATGFHARCWDEVVRQLPDRRIILLDSRCHGLSSRLEIPFDWQDFTADLMQVIKALDLNNIIAVGHSMGGHIIVRAAGQMPERFAKILAVDPVIFSSELPRMKDMIPEGMEHPVVRRKNDWQSSEEMYAAFKVKAPFNRWHAQVLKDYCDYGLGEGGLLCPPKLEGHIYFTPDSEAVYQVIPNIDCPVTIIRARSRNENDAPFSFDASPTNPELVSYFKNATDQQLPEQSHFIPMEIPHRVADMIREQFLLFVE